MSRLIVTGCSFTKYWHPTWAWFLADAFTDTYNYGQSGAGNEYIYHSIVDADTDLKLTTGDTVVIAWSGIARFDYLHEYQSRPGGIQWMTRGNWANNADFRTLEKYLNVSGSLRKSLNYMMATARYLRAKNIRYVFTSLTDMTDSVGSEATGVTPVRHTDEYCISLLNELHSANFIFPNGLINEMMAGRLTHQPAQKYCQGHPTMIEHQRFASAIATQLGVTIKEHELLKWVDITLGDNYPFINNTKILPTLSRVSFEVTAPIIGIMSSRERYGPDIIDNFKTVLDSLC